MEEILMEMQEKTEKEINVTELFWHILFGWRQIICFAVIFAIVLTGIKYLQDSRTYRMAQNAGKEEVKLTEEEREQVENAKIMMSRIEDFEKYLSSSALMQIDPYEKPVVELQYYVQSDYTYNYTKDNQNDYTGDLMSLYYDYVKSGEMSQKVIETAELSITQADFSELCTVSQSGRSMTVMFAWEEEKKLKEISDFIKSELSLKEAEFQEVGSHKLKLLRESRNVIADTELADKKNTILNNIATITTQLNNSKLAMSDQQLKQLYSESKGKNEEDDKSEIIKPTFSIKYMILGLGFGAFLVCMWIVCKEFFSVRLQSAEEIRTLYYTRLLGEIAVQPKKKFVLSAVDDKLLDLKNRRKKKLSVEQQVKIISANLALSCSQQEIDCVYMTGSEYENLDAVILGMLKKELSSQKIKVKEGANIYYDAESLKQGTEIGNMIFIEQTGKSIYDEISNELNLAREQNNFILGIVVLT